MQIAILDLKGVTDEIIERISAYYKSLDSQSKVEVLRIKDNEVKDCIGCWNCWVKTPGVCIHKDIMEKAYSSIVNSDVAIFMLDTCRDFLKGSNKTFIDRLIPLYSPYIKIYNGEMFHYRRYKKKTKIHFYYDSSFSSEENGRVFEGYLGRTIFQFSTTGGRIVVGDRVEIEPLNHVPALADLKSDKAPSDTKGKIIVYNCSPRGANSNSKIIIEEIKKGILTQTEDESNVEIRYLSQTQHHDEWAKDISNHSRHLFVLPLYVHAMPGLMMKFLERIGPINRDVSFSFLIQSGFFESSQSHFLRAYLARFTKSIGASYGGTAIKGGMEGIKMRPKESLKPVFQSFYRLGEGFARDGLIPIEVTENLSSPIRLSRKFRAIYKFAQLIGLANIYWNMQLKKNKAYDKRKATPYLK